MRTKKIVVLACAAATCLVVLTGAVGFAAGTQTASSSSMASNLAKKLGVSTSAVSTAFDEMRQEREAERLATMKKQLESAVDKGTITDAQRDTILTKLTAIQKKQAEVAELNTDLREWADSNDVDLAALGVGIGGRGGAGGGGPGGPGGMGGMAP